MLMIEDLPVPMLPCTTTVMSCPMVLMRLATWLMPSAYIACAVFALFIVLLQLISYRIYNFRCCVLVFLAVTMSIIRICYVKSTRLKA